MREKRGRESWERFGREKARVYDCKIEHRQGSGSRQEGGGSRAGTMWMCIRTLAYYSPRYLQPRIFFLAFGFFAWRFTVASLFSSPFGGVTRYCYGNCPLAVVPSHLPII